MRTLEIKDLHVSVEGAAVLKGVTLTLRQGEIHALMGPNGAGKSTLSQVIAGHPKYIVTKGQVLLDGKDLLSMAPDERARAGIFLAFQYPHEIQGLNFGSFLLHAYKARFGKDASPAAFNRALTDALKTLNLDRSFIDRSLNVGFSGGEKKRAEILQVLLLKPTFALFDETDSGLDIDSLNVVSSAINALRGPEFCALIVTHYQRILGLVKPDHVHVLIDGSIAQSGDSTLVTQLEQKGYAWLKPQLVKLGVKQ